MKKVLLRYGVFAILLLMSAGILFIMNEFEIRQKASVQLFVTGERDCVAYVARVPNLGFVSGDTVQIDQTLGGRLAFVVDSVVAEPASLVLRLRAAGEDAPLWQQLGGNSYTQGYVFTGNMKLSKLIVRKISM